MTEPEGFADFPEPISWHIIYDGETKRRPMVRTTFRISTRVVRGTTLTTALSLLFLNGCDIAEKAAGTPTLTPARSLVGTWRTALPVTFTYQSDFCSNQKETVAAADWTVTFAITQVTGDENKVNVQMTYSSANYRKLASNCGTGSTGYVPLVSPQFLTATVSSSAITISDTRNGQSFSGSFTTDLMEGTWVHWECIIYCTGEYTGSNQLKLIRQK